MSATRNTATDNLAEIGRQLANSGKHKPATGAAWEDSGSAAESGDQLGDDDRTPHSGDTEPGDQLGDDGTADSDRTVKTVPWPTLSPDALYGRVGRIIAAVGEHTEADPAAVVVQLLAAFGATVSGAYIMVGNRQHRAVIHPLICGGTQQGAKGTSWDVVAAILSKAIPEFITDPDIDHMPSGLSTSEGLIEHVRDPSGIPNTDSYDPGIADKRLLVLETEYASVLKRGRREGNELLPTLRQAWDGGTLRTMTRRKSRLIATSPHIVVVGHISPREFRSVLNDADLAGGNVNRLLLCLSKRSRLLSNLGNVPAENITAAAAEFRAAYEHGKGKSEIRFAPEFWSAWDAVYVKRLNRDRPESRLTAATARAVTQVLRLTLLYALFDGAGLIDAPHLRAAMALWAYCEASARWLFSSHEQEEMSEADDKLAAFIYDGGTLGRTRTEISCDHFHRNKTAAEIDAQLTPLVRDGVIVEVVRKVGGRNVTAYVHRRQRINELTNRAGQTEIGDELI